MRCDPSTIGVLAILLGILQPVGKVPFWVQEEARLSPPESTAMEKRLIVLANKERESRGLPPLRFSDSLAALARRHSADMASSGSLSHLSSSGQTLQQRLVQAGFFFERAGENVARSETFIADLVHRSLMESSEHRDNILEPQFDAVGIGVVRIEDGSYSITQDFIRAVEVLPPEAAKARMAVRIQEWRSAHSFPPLVFREDAGRLAQEFAEARIAENQPPPIAASLGQIHIFTVVTPSLGGLDERSFHLDDPSYDKGGFGVSFGRLRDYPGGAYCVVVALCPKNKYVSLGDGERADVIRYAINRIRQKGRLGSLETDERLAKEAARMAARISKGSPAAALRPSGALRGVVFAFQTSELEKMPREIEEIVLAPNIARIGVCALLVRSKDLPEGEFLVVGIVE